jgi:hypothetical protein
VVLYLLLNMAVAVAGFGIIFGLTYLLPAVIRRYGLAQHVMAVAHFSRAAGSGEQDMRQMRQTLC